MSYTDAPSVISPQHRRITLPRQTVRQKHQAAGSVVFQLRFLQAIHYHSVTSSNQTPTSMTKEDCNKPKVRQTQRWLFRVCKSRRKENLITTFYIKSRNKFRETNEYALV